MLGKELLNIIPKVQTANENQEKQEFVKDPNPLCFRDYHWGNRQKMREHLKDQYLTKIYPKYMKNSYIQNHQDKQKI